MQPFVLLTLVASVPTCALVTPANVSDNAGNYADENSQIVWADTPAGRPYSTKTLFNAGSNAGLYNMANQFLDVVMPMNELPYEAILGLAKGTVEPTTAIKMMMRQVILFAMCIVIGIIFIFVMPIVGCVFCACRLCNNCGGRRHQKNPTPEKFVCLFLALIVISLFLLAGAIMVYMVNSIMGDTLTKIQSLTTNNLDDVVTFMDNSAKELKFVAVDGSKFTRDVVFRDLDNIGEILGENVKHELSSGGNVDAVIREADEYGRAVRQISSSMNDVEQTRTDLLAQSNQLIATLTRIRTQLTAMQGAAGCGATCQAITVMQLNVLVPFNQIPSILRVATHAQNADQQDFASPARNARQHFDDIPQKIHRDTATVRQEVRTLLNGFIGTVEDSLDNMMSLPNSVRTPIASVKTAINNFFGSLANYDHYRSIASLILGLAVFVVFFLQTVGMVFGVIGFKYEAAWNHPTRRSAISNTGGILLIISVACVFIYSSFLMFLVTATFFVGGTFDKFLCEPLMDPEYKAFQELLDKPGGIMGGNEYFFAKTILANGSIPLTASGALESCRKNQGAFTALKLDSVIDLDAMTDVNQITNIDHHVRSIDINLTDVNFVSTAQETILNDFANNLNIDYTLFKNVLQQETMMPDYRENVVRVRQSSTDPANTAVVNNQLVQVADTLERTTNNEVDRLENGQRDLLQKVIVLEALTNGIPARTAAFIAEVGRASDFVTNSGANAVRSVITNYTSRIFGIADQFTAHLRSSIRNDILRCRPVWDLWHSIVHDGLCTRIVQVLNGFWYALGWCIFFMLISLILNVRLAKYLRRMRTEEMSEESGVGIDQPVHAVFKNTIVKVWTTMTQPCLKNRRRKIEQNTEQATYDDNFKRFTLVSANDVNSGMPYQHIPTRPAMTQVPRYSAASASSQRFQADVTHQTQSPYTYTNTTKYSENV